MFQVPSNLPHTSEISVRRLGPIGVIYYKIFSFINVPHRHMIYWRTEHLNKRLDQLRNLHLEAQTWQLEEVQNYINYCCHSLGIPSVNILSQEYFNLEQLEAAFFTGNLNQHDIEKILHYVGVVLQQILMDETSTGLDVV